MEPQDEGRRDERHRKRYRSRSRSDESDNGRDHRRRERKHRDEIIPHKKRYEDDRSERRHRDDERHRKHRRSRSPRDEVRRSKSSRDLQQRAQRSSSPDARNRDDREASRAVKRSGPLPSQEASFKDSNGDLGTLSQDGKPLPEKEQPNYKPTGLLAAASNSVAQADGTSIVLKYHEPPEARKPSPKDQWKLFVFKGGDIVNTIDLNHRSCWLIGRELAVVDLPAEHPSISKQHAVIQFRYIEKRNEYGDKSGKVRPYLIDLDSANGTALNKEPIPGSRYLELRDKDMIQFGDSTREYVLMLAPKS